MPEITRKKVWEVCVVILDHPADGVEFLTEDEIEKEVDNELERWARTSIDGVTIDEVNARELDE